MAPTRSFHRPKNGVERVRHELLLALHFGRLTPGDRVPSVRRLAGLTGMNRKTVHRAYTRLAGEGLLDLRPGSGTFIAEGGPGAGRAASVGGLLSAANRARAAAETLGLSPSVFSAFLDIYLGRGLSGLPLAVAECNHEQLGLIEHELRTGLGLAVRPVLLSELAAKPEAALSDMLGVVTTDCHRAEVAALTRSLGAPVYRVALDSDFPQRLLAHAASGPVLMIVRDRAFAPVFLRLLRRIGGDFPVDRRFRIVEPLDARSYLRGGSACVAVHVSPLVDRATIPVLPAGVLRLRGRWRLEPRSMDRLKASLALDQAVRRRSA
jgi:DNA-binding transcriptional regulator YhcF (GntR family)